MADRKYYVMCEQNCKFESMTKEQILTAITQAVNEGTIGDIDTGFVTTIKTINGASLRFFVGTQSEYEQLEDKSNLFAIITNDTSKEALENSIKAVQDAIVELRNTSVNKETAQVPNSIYFRSNNTNIKCGGEVRRAYADTPDGCGMNLVSVGDYTDSNSEKAAIKVFHSERKLDRDRLALCLTREKEQDDGTKKRVENWYRLYGEHFFPAATSSRIGGVKSGGDITVDTEGNVTVNKASIINPNLIDFNYDFPVESTKEIFGKKTYTKTFAQGEFDNIFKGQFYIGRFLYTGTQWEEFTTLVHVTPHDKFPQRVVNLGNRYIFTLAISKTEMSFKIEPCDGVPYEDWASWSIAFYCIA